MGVLEISIYFKKYSQKNTEFVYDTLFNLTAIGLEQRNKNTNDIEVIKISSKEKIKELKKEFSEGKRLWLGLFSSYKKSPSDKEESVPLCFTIHMDLTEKYKGQIYIQFNANFASGYTINNIHLYDYLKKNFIKPIIEHCEIDELMFNDTKIV
jgi:hypothetical protein